MLKRLARAVLLLLAALTALAIYLWFSARPARPHPWFADLPVPLLIAHQGGECEWPSNTMEAFRQAHRLGSDVLDMDVHLTADDELVLMHDTTVDRTTDGKGPVRELTWAQLQKLDAAYHFTTDGGKTYPYRGRGLRIPRLEEVIVEFPNCRLGLEMKQAPLEAAGRLAELLKRHKCEQRVLLACFDESMMKELRRACPDSPTSATPNEVRLFLVASRLHLEDLISPDYQSLQIPLRHGNSELVTRRTVEAAHRRGLKVLPWTIDSLLDAEICRRAGADGLNTNYPTRMEPLRQSWRLR